MISDCLLIVLIVAIVGLIIAIVSYATAIKCDEDE